MKYILFVWVCLGFVFQDRISLCNSPGCPGSHFVDQAGLKLRDLPGLQSEIQDQAGLKLRDLPASASQALGLKVCAITARHFLLFFQPELAKSLTVQAPFLT